jgi:hypothetical protein
MKCQVEKLKEVIDQSLKQFTCKQTDQKCRVTAMPNLSFESSLNSNNSSNYRITDDPADDTTNGHLNTSALTETDHNSMIGLENIHEDDLANSLEMLKIELENINAEKILNLQTGESGAQMKPGVFVKPVHNDILPKESSDCVRYLHVAEIKSKFSIGIFVFPPHSKIPLHDHPGMVVLSRILYGSISSTSYDIISDEDCDDSISIASKDQSMIDEMAESFGDDECYENKNNNLLHSMNSMHLSLSSLTSFAWNLPESSSNHDKSHRKNSSSSDMKDNHSNKSANNSWMWNFIPSLQKNYWRKEKEQKIMPSGSLRAKKWRPQQYVHPMSQLYIHVKAICMNLLLEKMVPPY